jgi:phosphopantothenoylcysteine decarboxylase/phosphopantothenate--cysteine ligase
MEDAVLKRFAKADVLIMVAAVADFRPRQAERGKIKRGEKGLLLELEPTPDILSLVAKRRKPGQRVVGFALETERCLANARRKLREKGLDLVVLNSPEALGSDANRVTLIDRKGCVPLPEMSKSEVAGKILDRVARGLVR